VRIRFHRNFEFTTKSQQTFDKQKKVFIRKNNKDKYFDFSANYDINGEFMENMLVHTQSGSTEA
jgi:hypothetical protein